MDEVVILVLLAIFGTLAGLAAGFLIARSLYREPGAHVKRGPYSDDGEK